MLDELLGRADLKARIEALTEEQADLESRLEAEQERRKTAVRERQEAEERVNHLEDRIAGLEGELEQLRSDEDEVAFQWVGMLSRERIASVLDRLETLRTESEGAYTTGITENVPRDASELLDDRAALVDRARPCILCVDDEKLVRAMLAPPRHPGPFESWADGFRLEREWFLPTGRFTFAVARADLFAMGTYAGPERVDFEGFESDVMGRHSKGGFSQARFERRRNEQVAEHRERVTEALEQRDVSDLILVGDRRTVSALDVDADTTGTVDASGSPAEALEDAFRSFWRTRLYIP